MLRSGNKSNSFFNLLLHLTILNNLLHFNTLKLGMYLLPSSINSAVGSGQAYFWSFVVMDICTSGIYQTENRKCLSHWESVL